MTENRGRGRANGSAPFADWAPDWRGLPCVLIGSGPSRTKAQTELVRIAAVKTIAINSAFRDAPWADMLFGADDVWWQCNDTSGFDGLQVTTAVTIGQEGRAHYVEARKAAPPLILDRPGMVGSGNHSGFQALNLAINLGCDPIIKVGYDCSVANGRHCHTDHVRPMGNPDAETCILWKNVFEDAARQLLLEPLVTPTVINASLKTTIEGFQRENLVKVLASFLPVDVDEVVANACLL